MKDLGIVIIGRNEGDRLIRCIASVGDEALVIYVDSGSTDESVAAARSRSSLDFNKERNKCLRIRAIDLRVKCNICYSL